jgi:hypothetical protein
VSRRKDRERFLRLKQQNPNYTGFRGDSTAPADPPAPLESVTCSVCRRKRNVPVDSLPQDRSTFVCLQCQERQAESEPHDPA